MSTKAARKEGSRVEGAVARVDTSGVTLAPTLVHEITFQDLRRFVEERVGATARAKRKTEGQIKQEISQTTSALKRAENVAGSSSVRLAVETEIERAEQDARKGNRNPKRRATHLLELLDQLETRRINEASVDDVASPADQSPRRSPFARSIVSGREAKGLSQTELAEKLGLCSATMSRWEHLTIPVADGKTHAIINRMESILGYEAEFQWELIADTSRRFASWPAGIPNKDSLRRRISEKVGNLRRLSEAEQQTRRLAVYAEIQEEDNSTVRFEPYSLGMNLDFSKWPDLFADDWVKLLQAHMEFEKLPDGRPHLVAPPDKSDASYMVDRTTGKELYMDGALMLHGSARYNSKAVSLIFGCCVNPIRIRETKDTRTNDAPTLEKPADSNANGTKPLLKLPPLFGKDVLATMGLAIAVCPEIAEHYFRAHRIMRALLNKPSELSNSHVKYIGLLKKIVRWISQQPHFIDRLRPIPGLLTERQIKKARRDWRDFCAKVILRYEEIYKGKKNKAAESFDHAAEIEDFLVHEPQIGLLAIFDSFADELRPLKERDDARAIKLRDTVATAFKALCYYRPGTDFRLDWKADNTGHLRHHVEDGCKVWRMHLSKHDVKNHYSQAMKDGESRLLVDIGKRFYGILEEYLSWGRAFILAGRKTDAIIVRTFGDPRHTPDTYGTYVERLTSYAMKEDKPEFYGAKRLNCIQIRKAGASDAYKEEGTLEAAGKAIGNTAKEAQVYVKVLSAEHTKKSTERTQKADERRRLKLAISKT